MFIWVSTVREFQADHFCSYFFMHCESMLSHLCFSQQLLSFPAVASLTPLIPRDF